MRRLARNGTFRLPCWSCSRRHAAASLSCRRQKDSVGDSLVEHVVSEKAVSVVDSYLVECGAALFVAAEDVGIVSPACPDRRRFRVPRFQRTGNSRQQRPCGVVVQVCFLDFGCMFSFRVFGGPEPAADVPRRHTVFQPLRLGYRMTKSPQTTYKRTFRCFVVSLLRKSPQMPLWLSPSLS